ncbi:CLUMA_CG000574, isoform A [Clunio marinus]|uniref:CLUMA_CG000574, isoform A n=1 Tax=Clunio marinus TaxID=568069 RepID=A0A1J1HFF1_9DIPT|nr:CLUMA_CG000574, isoform A [Clunio marinus]
MRIILRFLLILIISLRSVNGQDNNQVDDDGKNKTTNFEITCQIYNKTYTGEECLRSLEKFGKVVSYIVTGFVVIVLSCCCGWLMCICKIFHNKKHRNNGQILQMNHHNPTVATVA